MDNAQLNIRPREDGLDGLRKSPQIVDARDQDVLDSPLAQVRQCLQPEPGTLIVSHI